MEATPNPIGFLNSLRGIAAWMVCMYHCAFILKPLYPELLPIFDWGQEGVYVFFVISGVVLPWSLEQGKYSFKNLDKFFLKRVVRLYPPFIISAVAYIIRMRLTEKNAALSDMGMFQMFVDSITFQAPFKETRWVIDMYWTLFVEFQYYIYLAIIFPFLANDKRSIRLIAYYGTLGLTFLSQFFHGNHSKENLFFHLPIFAIGFSLFLFYKKNISKLEFWSGVVISFAVGLSNIYFRMQLGTHIMVVVGCTFLVIYFIKSGPSWLNFIGEISYSYYLLHMLFVSIIYGAFYEMEGSAGLVLITFILIQVCSILGAWIMYRLIEKPSLALTKKIRYPS